jgi:hypothetical protein
LLGVVATLGEECLGVPAHGLNEQLLRQSIMISGGTNEIQRNVIAPKGRRTFRRDNRFTDSTGRMAMDEETAGTAFDIPRGELREERLLRASVSEFAAIVCGALIDRNEHGSAQAADGKPEL